MATVAARRTFRGPARVLPPETIRAVCRRIRNGEPIDAVAAEYGISRRTVYRYLDDPLGVMARRFATALRDWPRADLLQDADRVDLARWLAEVFDGWHR